MKQSLKVSLCLLGAIIGAGFATGKEIASFFVKYGKMSLFGILIASLLFGIYIYAVLSKMKKENITSPHMYLCSISNSIFAKAALFVTYAFLFVIFCVMITGGAEIIEDIFSENG